MAGPNSCPKDWVDIFSALLTPTIAIGVALIGWLQWRINKARYKHELFDRRWEQFASIRDYLSSILISGKVIPEEETKFFIKTRGCRFVFGSDIETFVKQIYEKGIYLHALDEELDPLSVGDERTKNVQRQSEIKTWISDQLKTIDDRFSTYLDLGN